MELEEILGLLVSLVVAILGVSAITVKIRKRTGSRMKNTRGNNVNQEVTSGDNNIQAGRDVKINDRKG